MDFLRISNYKYFMEREENIDFDEWLRQIDEEHNEIIFESNQDILTLLAFFKAKRFEIIDIDLSKEITLNSYLRLFGSSINTRKGWLLKNKVKIREISHLDNIKLIDINHVPDYQRSAILKASKNKPVISINLSEEMDIKDFMSFASIDKQEALNWIKTGRINSRTISELDDLILIRIDSYTSELMLKKPS